MKSLKLLGMVAIGIGLFAVQPLHAKDSIQLAEFKAKLSQVSPIDLPMSTSTLVSEASSKSREAVTTDAVRAAVGIKATAAASIVGAVAHATPSMATRAALAAASVAPHKQLHEIVKAAAAAAPSEAGNIVAAFVKEYPAKTTDIAVAASEGAPTAGRQILAAVGNVAPTLQAAIKKVLDAGNSSDIVPVQAVLTQSALVASQFPQVSKTSVVAPVAGGISAPPQFFTLPSGQTEFTDPNNPGQVETVDTDPGFIQSLLDAGYTQSQNPIVVGSPSR